MYNAKKDIDKGEPVFPLENMHCWKKNWGPYFHILRAYGKAACTKTAKLSDCKAHMLRYQATKTPGQLRNAGQHCIMITLPDGREVVIQSSEHCLITEVYHEVSDQMLAEDHSFGQSLLARGGAAGITQSSNRNLNNEAHDRRSVHIKFVSLIN